MRRTVRVEMPGGPDAARHARAALAELAERVGPGSFEDLRLMASEIATNSVRHARAGRGERITLEVFEGVDTVRIEVTDTGPGFEPGIPAPQEDQASGWGLYLVERLATRWGVETGAVTKVWFELNHRAKPRG